jgi:hypothetical protein
MENEKITNANLPFAADLLASAFNIHYKFKKIILAGVVSKILHRETKIWKKYPTLKEALGIKSDAKYNPDKVET